MPNLIISPVGTSLLTNNAGDGFPLLRDTANCRESELTPEQKSKIDEIALIRADKLQNTDRYSDYKDISAELNGIFSYKVPDNGDYHILIATDTYQCGLVSDIIADTLKKYGSTVVIPEFRGLSTKSKADFESGIDQIIDYMDSTIGGYRDMGCRIVFNLTGGFKAVIGYLNLLAMFHADEILYIFEKNDELIRIPRIPVKIDEEKIGGSTALMAMLDQPGTDCMMISKLNRAGVSTDNLYEALFTVIETDGARYISLSTYGKIVWNSLKEDKYRQLIDFPYLDYTGGFRDSFEKGQSMQEFQRRTNASLALLSALLIENDFNMTVLSGNSTLEYENLKGGIGHYRISDRPLSYRGFCTPKDSRLLMIDCGKHNLDDKYQNLKPEKFL